MAHWFRIKPKQFFVKAKPLDSITPQAMPLQEVLKKNNIDNFNQMRIISFGGENYYQIKRGEQLDYYRLNTGEVLQNGDKKYAEFLARHFWGDQQSAIQEIDLIKDFTSEYKSINRLLPAYKVAFDDKKQTDVYVETASSRYGTTNDIFKKRMTWVFTQFHNWQFLDFNPTFKILALLFFSMLTFLSALTGLFVFGFFWKSYLKFKNLKESKTRVFHRTIGLLVTVSMLAFSFSGGFHAFKKFKPDPRNQYFANETIQPTDVEISPFAYLNLLKGKAGNVSIVKMNDDLFYQYHILGKAKEKQYVNVKTGEIFTNGDDAYARYLASEFTGKKPSEILETKIISNFKTEAEYGFINKRLPVIKVQFDDKKGTRQYIETSTGKLSAQFENNDELEGFSFAFLHKYHGFDFLGKDWRDFIMAMSCLMLLLVNLLGVLLLFRKK